jgi:hypothetical protein
VAVNHRVSLFLALLVLGLGLDPARGEPQAAPIAKGQQLMTSPLTRIGFERSGGFYHQPIGGAVSLQGGAGEVASDFTGGSRPLSEDELRQLQALDLAALAASPFALGHGGPRPGPPEGYQYDITIETADGRRTVLRFHEEPPEILDRATPGLGALAAWVRAEVAVLWRQKAGARPAPG